MNRGLPKGVERWSLVTNRQRHREEMTRDEYGSYIRVSDLPAIEGAVEARVREELGAAVKGAQARGALYDAHMRYQDVPRKTEEGWATAALDAVWDAALAALKPDGAEEGKPRRRCGGEGGWVAADAADRARNAEAGGHSGAAAGWIECPGCPDCVDGAEEGRQ